MDTHKIHDLNSQLLEAMNYSDISLYKILPQTRISSQIIGNSGLLQILEMANRIRMPGCCHSPSFHPSNKCLLLMNIEYCYYWCVRDSYSHIFTQYLNVTCRTIVGTDIKNDCTKGLCPIEPHSAQCSFSSQVLKMPFEIKLSHCEYFYLRI